MQSSAGGGRESSTASGRTSAAAQQAFPPSGRDSGAASVAGDSRRQRSVSTASTNRAVLELRNVMEHRPSSAREAALETFAVIAKKRICVVRKFGSHMDNHVSFFWGEKIKSLMEVFVR